LRTHSPRTEDAEIKKILAKVCARYSIYNLHVFCKKKSIIIYVKIELRGDNNIQTQYVVQCWPMFVLKEMVKGLTSIEAAGYVLNRC
jgi:hypothetical protein